MRQVVLNIETTGLDSAKGDRIVEIAAVELLDRHISDKHFHCYLNPEREINPGAQEVHGITLEFLKDKPKFADVALELIAFIRGAELVAHNAPFDMAFLNYELSLLGLDQVEALCSGIIDSLIIAREQRPTLLLVTIFCPVPLWIIFACRQPIPKSSECWRGRATMVAWHSVITTAFWSTLNIRQ